MKRWKLAGAAMALFLAGVMLTAGLCEPSVPTLAQLGFSDPSTMEYVLGLSLIHI